MKVFGICMARNEADVIRLSILHHLALGCDAVLVLDNGSTDGATQILERLGRHDSRVQWSTDPGLLNEVVVRSELAREAFRQGADWVVPFDADEFWWERQGGFRERLAGTSAGVLRCKLVHFVQDRSRLESSEDALLTMTQRAPISHVDQTAIETRQFAYVERRPHKCIFRPTADVVVEFGSHSITGAAGAKSEASGLACLHAPLRSRAGLEHKADHGERALESGFSAHRSWHLKRWAQLRATGDLDLEWAANSYEGTSLDVYGNEKPLVKDNRLRNAIAPLLLDAAGASGQDSDTRGAARPTRGGRNKRQQ